MANKSTELTDGPCRWVAAHPSPARATPPRTAARPATGSASNIDVSDTARTLAVLEREIGTLPVVNESRVDAVRRAARRRPLSRRPAARRRQDAALRSRPARHHPGPQVTPERTRGCGSDPRTLGRLLAEENAALAEFESLLDQEHAALRTRDIDALEALAEARQASIIHLLKIEDERRSLCSMLGYDTDLAGLAKLIAWCDPARTLAGSLRRMRHARPHCRDLNDRNGVLVGAQIKRVEGLLGAITGTRPSRAPTARAASRIPTLRLRPGSLRRSLIALCPPIDFP